MFHNFPFVDVYVDRFVDVRTGFPYFHRVATTSLQDSRCKRKSLFGGNGWKSIGNEIGGNGEKERTNRFIGGQPCMHVRRNPLTRILSMEFRCYFVWNSSRADRITFFRGNRNRSTYWPFLIPAEWRKSKNGSCRWLESKWKRSGRERRGGTEFKPYHVWTDLRKI